MVGRLAIVIAVVMVVVLACGARSAPSGQAGSSPSHGSSSPDILTPPPATPAGTPVAAPSRAADASVAALTLGPDMIAVVVTNDLVIRSEPGISDDSSVYTPYLGRRDQLYVLHGPVHASGYDWYEVRPLSARFEDAGWVAAASKAGEAWIKPSTAAPACPPLPATVTELEALPSGARLACFSGVQITVRSQLQGCGLDMPDAMYEPEMFNGFYDPRAEDLIPVMLGEPGADPCEMDEQLQLRIDPATVSADQVPVGGVAELTGIFDHPGAADCELVSFLVDLREPDPDWCRPQFVVTRIE
jgi:hypothetical protein